MSEDYYSILGVSKTASKSEIYKGYRKMAAKWHPDICKDKDVANTQMKKINAAYEILSNEEKKMQYDQFLNQGGNTQDFNEHQQGGYDYNNMEFDAKNLSDIFSSFFSSNNSSSTRFYYNSNEQASYFDSDYTDNTATAKGANKSIRIRMTLEEWYCGSNTK